jgi:hypothetical protein
VIVLRSAAALHKVLRILMKVRFKNILAQRRIKETPSKRGSVLGLCGRNLFPHQSPFWGKPRAA